MAYSGGTVFANRVLARTPDVSDFVSPSTVLVSSTDPATDTTVIADVVSNSQQLNGGGTTRHGTKYTGTALRGKKIKNIKFYLGPRTGAPTGDMVATIRKVSDDSVIATSDPVDAATYLPNSLVDFNFPSEPAVPDFDVYFLLEYSGGDNLNYIRSSYRASNVFADGIRVTRAGSYNEFATNDVYMSLEFATFSSKNLNDNNSATSWKSNVEANPYVTVDFGSPVLIAGLRIYWNSDGRPSNFTIAISNDDIDYSNEIITYTQMPATGYVNYTFGVKQARYIRVKANETLAMEMAEILMYTQTADELAATHGHGVF